MTRSFRSNAQFNYYEILNNRGYKAGDNGVIVLSYYNPETDIIDLSALYSISSFDYLQYTDPPLTFYLTNGAVLVLVDVESIEDIQARNIIFGSGVPPSSSTNPGSTKSIASTLAVAGMLVGLSLVALRMESIMEFFGVQKKKTPEEEEKRRRFRNRYPVKQIHPAPPVLVGPRRVPRPPKRTMARDLPGMDKIDEESDSNETDRNDRDSIGEEKDPEDHPQEVGSSSLTSSILSQRDDHDVPEEPATSLPSPPPATKSRSDSFSEEDSDELISMYFKDYGEDNDSFSYSSTPSSLSLNHASSEEEEEEDNGPRHRRTCFSRGAA
jgi:hypothetical protein